MNEAKNNIQTAKQKLLKSVKEAAYNFNKKDFKQFQNFFTEEFADTNPEKIKNQAWRTR